MDRREFFREGPFRALGVLVCALAAYPVFRFMTFRKIRKTTVTFPPAPDIQSRVLYRKGVFLTARGPHPRALSARCSHLGCTVRFDEVTQTFRCPCHGSVFDADGKRLEGPARKPLEALPVTVGKDKEILVTRIL
ncbi:MAG: ubiquinol-cytochrome c reductase iron-sulfur subunit [Deltaproteobacteria bacterium]|nr:ubiquinol-cytochrome c reductase iron-sulfur subunit [Deltaproteobacteria bacterium]MBW1922791.1 ubiquinol-cytochrome c reductase iron-sulfur subunit [Deltaproteobacteria bacterium]MBW1950004.1 ubiquinol-cytochrome c reductase iron-sulfur subunit [Deltaproteobacteria bacterium]MBW2008299.1 ubiquinol-cytochrome c reductase iron-sulfur subunit [Deltaproteobacteria bacterium]RLB39675.1 MAG: cytochrome B6 [Deltaproteobacteria bacterium]